MNQTALHIFEKRMERPALIPAFSPRRRRTVEHSQEVSCSLASSTDTISRRILITSLLTLLWLISSSVLFSQSDPPLKKRSAFYTKERLADIRANVGKTPWASQL